MISDDVGLTWREAGGGLPVGTAVAVDHENPDRLLFASATRVYLSETGGLFWRSLEVELIDITALAAATPARAEGDLRFAGHAGLAAGGDGALAGGGGGHDALLPAAGDFPG